MFLFLGKKEPKKTIIARRRASPKMVIFGGKGKHERPSLVNQYASPILITKRDYRTVDRAAGDLERNVNRVKVR